MKYTVKKNKIQLSDHFTYVRLLRFVIPSIGMMVFTSVYGVVDGLFVSNIVGKTAFAAINLIMPVEMIGGGIGFMIGTGGAALVAKTLGEQRQERAEQYFYMMISATAVVGIIICIFIYIFMEPICIALGANSDMINDCVTYGRISMYFNVFFMLQNSFQDFLIAAEKPHLGLLCTVFAGLSNIILDALLIYVFHMGVAGAAYATGISEFIGAMIPLVYFIRPNSSLLNLKRCKPELRPIAKACGNGVSEMVTSITSSFVSMFYNVQLLKYIGSDGVAAYGVLMYVQFIFAAIFIGYAMGCSPVIGYHYGARNTNELGNILSKSFKLLFITGTVMLAIGEFLAKPLSSFFVGYDTSLLILTVHAMRITTLCFIIVGINIFASSFFTALNNGWVSAIISFLRTFVFKLSFVILLPILIGIEGIWWSNTLSEIAAFIISMITLALMRKRYDY
jgi:putative efflux protein, MATE family